MSVPTLQRTASACLVALVVLAAESAAVAGPRDNLTARNTMLCDRDEQVCVRGTLTYDRNPRLFELRSRVVRASGPGLLRFRVVGQNNLGHVRRATIEVQIRGRPSEIVNTRMVPDWPDVNDWELEAISFVPKSSPPGRSRSVR